MFSIGHKGEHREANTRHDQDDITLQDLALVPAPRQHLHHKENKNYNKVAAQFQLYLIFCVLNIKLLCKLYFR